MRCGDQIGFSRSPCRRRVRRSCWWNSGWSNGLRSWRVGRFEILLPTLCASPNLRLCTPVILCSAILSVLLSTTLRLEPLVRLLGRIDNRDTSATFLNRSEQASQTRHEARSRSPMDYRSQRGARWSVKQIIRAFS